MTQGASLPSTSGEHQSRPREQIRYDDDPLGQGIPGVREKGVELLGSPIGATAFSRQLVEKRVKKVAAAQEILPTLEDSHVKFCLLRSCLSLPKIALCVHVL